MTFNLGLVCSQTTGILFFISIYIFMSYTTIIKLTILSATT
jgi:hypothetical protein